MSDPREWTDGDWQDFDARFDTEDAAFEAHSNIAQIVYDAEQGNLDDSTPTNDTPRC